MNCSHSSNDIQNPSLLRVLALEPQRDCVLVRSFTVVLVFGLHSLGFAATDVGGVLPRETTWTTTYSPYVVKQNVEVPSGGKLTIEPGTEVRFERFSLIVKGQVSARGTKEHPIVFTSNQENPKPGDWLFLQLMPESARAEFGPEREFRRGCVFEHCVIEYGSGFNLVGASPWIARSSIRHNYSVEGGGIFSGGGNPMILNNVISYNRCDRDGGGIRSADGHPTILGNEIVYNTARSRGGGIATNYSPSTIRGNTIAHNWAHTGGGIATGTPRLNETSMSGQSHSAPVIENNLIAHNSARAIGGGISVRGVPRIIGNRILFNRIMYDGLPRKDHRASRMKSTDRRESTGAGIHIEGTYGGPADVARNVIVGNRGAKWGGGLFTDRASLAFSDNFVVRNQAVEFGGGLSIVNRKSSRSFISKGHGPSIAITGSEFRDNDGGDLEVSGVGGQTVTMQRCNIHTTVGLAVLNHCVTPISAKEVWWMQTAEPVNARIYDGSDDQRLGRVLHSAPSSPYPLERSPKVDDAMLSQLTARPKEFRSAQGIFQVQGAPPSISAVWEGIEEPWVAGYRLQVLEIVQTYRERVVAKTDKGYSPIDVGTSTSVRIGGLKPKTNYEISVWAYDSDGIESLSTEPLSITTKPN